ncbi:MAG: FHA domain-containing protein [Lachnospiraceae bacterium]|nr:FHA domain-containing protein [Lachnospiraceae bacterium]
MEVWQQNEGFHQYLILNIPDADMDSFEMNMLMRYEGSRLLPLEFQCKNGVVNISYEMSGAASIQQIFQGKEMDGEILQVLFTSLWECYEELEAYLLPIEGVLLQPEWIYYQPGKRQIRFCYLPKSGGAFYPGFLSLVEFCMKRTRHQDSEAVLFIYGLYRLLQEGNAEWEELKGYIMRFTKETSDREAGVQMKEENRAANQDWEETLCDLEDKEVCESEVKIKLFSRQNLEMAGYIYGGLALAAFLLGLFFGIRFLFLSHRETDIKLVIIMVILLIIFLYGMMRSRRTGGEQKGIPEIREGKNVDGTSLIIRDMLQEETMPEEVVPEETSILTIAVEVEAALWELESMQMQVSGIALHNLPAVLGRKPEEVDYVVSNAGISRRHVMLFQSGEDLYAEDLASTNGTCINGVRLKAGEPIKVKDGDRLSIGPNQYQVKRKH